MPNDVSTTFKIDGRDKDIVLGIMREAEDENILNAFIPTPQIYLDYNTDFYTTDHDRATAHNKLELSIGMQVGFNTFVSEEYYRKFKEAEEYQKNTYGLIGENEWCWENWGTDSRGTYNVEIEGDEVYFETAWEFPAPLFKELARRNYDICLKGHFVDPLCFSGIFELWHNSFHWGYHSDEEFMARYGVDDTEDDE